MKRNYCLSLVLLALFGVSAPFAANAAVESVLSSQSTQQAKKITGKVLDAAGEPIIGASVLVKGSGTGAVTDIDGNFSVEAPVGSTLEVSFIGYKTVTLKVTNATTYTVSLQDDSQALDEVVVTAMGIKKERKALGYSMEDVKSDELMKMKTANPISSLSGKVAGVNVTQSSGAAGAGAQIILRGGTSGAEGKDNQPLFVVDGVIFDNSSSVVGNSAFDGSMRSASTTSNRLMDINPEDIESMSVLKGPAAAALYGSRAANGVILITTKKGNSVGRRDIHFSTGLTFEKAFCLPKMQNNYGVSDVTDSWGEKENLMAYDNLNNFFRTGLTSITSVSVNSGNDRLQTYFSYANTTGRGILNENKLSKHNINLRETAVLFNSLLKLDGNVNVMRQTVKNKPVSGGFYMNPLVGLYRFPRGEDLSYYKDNYEHYDEERKLNTQNWHTFTEDFEQNPYWIQNRIQSKEARTRLILSLSANLKVTGWLTLQARGNMDYSADKLRQKFYASTATALCGICLLYTSPSPRD